ncbi:MAG: hypothetical protein KDC98_21505 [Planctomycetes bacterium]|nr:hypothetical protein [Planctomycetota bacterium]
MNTIAALLLLGLVMMADVPAQSFGASATGTLYATGGGGSTPQTYTGAITPPGTSISSAGWFGGGWARVTFGVSSLGLDMSATDAGGANGTVVLTLDAPAGAGVRVQIAGYVSLLGSYSVDILGTTYSPTGPLAVDAVVPAGGLPITAHCGANGYPFYFSQTTLSLSWSYPGVSVAGTPTPGCRGDAVAWTNGIPTLGNSGFGVTCSNAHPLRGGVSLIGLGGLSTPFAYDYVDVWVDPTRPLATLYVPSNAAGEMVQAMPIPGHASFVGLQLFAQWILLEPPGCTPLDLSGSNAIAITVQP